MALKEFRWAMDFAPVEPQERLVLAGIANSASGSADYVMNARIEHVASAAHISVQDARRILDALRSKGLVSYSAIELSDHMKGEVKYFTCTLNAEDHQP